MFDALQILANAADPLIVTDAQGSIFWCNQAAEKLFGIALGNSPHLRGIVSAESLKLALATRSYTTMDAEVMRPSGAAIRFTLLVLEVGSGDPDGVCYLMAFKATHSEKHALAQREEHLATAAHDLKNPL